MSPGSRSALVRVVALAIFSAVAAWTPAGAQSADPFFKGKTITILIGFPPGGTYDQYARLALPHYGRHIPGNPSVIMQSKPGGSGVVAINYFIANAPKDGTILAIFPEVLAISQLTAPDMSKWDTRQFTYIGRFVGANGVFVLRKGAPAQTLADMRMVTTHVGCNGRTGASYINPMLLKTYAGMQFDLHCGYPGSNDISIALERGEIDITAGVWSGWRTRSMLIEGTVRPVIQSGLKRHPELADVPLMQEIIEDPQKARIAEFLSAGAAIGRSLLTFAAVPKDRIAILREAFDKMLADPAFQADAAKMKLDIEPESGVELDAITAKLLATPPDVVRIATEITKEQ